MYIQSIRKLVPSNTHTVFFPLPVRGVSLFILILALLPGCGADTDSVDLSCTQGNGNSCTVPCSDLLNTLDTASPGDSYSVSSCALVGQISVPPGVTLIGDASGVRSQITLSAHGEALTVNSLAGLTTNVSGFDVYSEASVATLLMGDGEISLSNMDILSRSGFGLIADGLSSLTASNLQFTGLIEDPSAIQYPINPRDFPAIGVAAFNVHSLLFDDVNISGFSGFGSVISQVNGTWGNSLIDENLGVGLLLNGGTMNIENTTISNTDNCPHISCALNNQVFALAVTSPDNLEAIDPGGILGTETILYSSGLTLSDNGGIAYFQDGDGTVSVHDGGLLIEHNEQVGIWLQDISGSLDAPAFQISSDGASLEDNGGVALFAGHSSGISIENTSLNCTQLMPTIVEGRGSIDMGDGMQIVQLGGALSLNGVDIASDNAANNARVGLLIDGDLSGLNDVSMNNIQITGDGGLGMILQNGALTDGEWDIDVDESLSENDASFDGTLEVASNISTSPSANLTGSGGLIGSTGLVDEQGNLGSNVSIQEGGVLNTDEDEDISGSEVATDG